MSAKQNEVVILRESVLASWAKDLVTFALFAGTMYFNHKVLSGNGWVDVLLLLMVIFWLAGLQSSRAFRGTRAEAINWLQEKERAE